MSRDPNFALSLKVNSFASFVFASLSASAAKFNPTSECEFENANCVAKSRRVRANCVLTCATSDLARATFVLDSQVASSS